MESLATPLHANEELLLAEEAIYVGQPIGLVLGTEFKETISSC